MPRQRITLSQLEAVTDILNRMTGNPATPYSKNDAGAWASNLGNFHISRAYGGFALHQMATDGGGIRDVLYTGHIPARQLFDLIHAYRAGLEAVEAATKRIQALEQDKLSLMRDILAPFAA
jgi:hypothetical protein